MYGHRLIIALVLIAGVTATALAGWYSYRHYHRVDAEQAAIETDNAVSAVRLALDRVALAVRAVRALYAADWVTQDQFERFAKTLTATEGIRSLGFWRRVTNEERAAYERRFTTEPAASLGIWEFDPNGKPVRAPERPLYFVVESGHLTDGSTTNFGLDAATLPSRRAVIDAALARSDLAASPIIQFINAAGTGILLAVPAVDRSDSVVGVATGTVSLRELGFVAMLASGAPEIAISAGDEAPPPAAGDAAPSVLAGGASFVFGGREWTVDAPSSASPGVGWWIVLLIVGAGLATTAAIAAWLVGLARTAEVVEARGRLQGMLDGLGPLAWLLQPDGSVVNANRAARAAFNRSEAEMVGKSFAGLAANDADPSQPDRIRQALARAAGGEEDRFDLVLAGGDGERAILDLWIRPLERGAGPPASLVASAVDITDRYEAEETQRLLMRELDHRMKNTLHVVQAIIRRTARAQSTVERFEGALLGRVSAMSRAHELLARERWQGAEIATIVHQETGAFEVSNSIRWSGPSLRLNPRAALSIAMAIHELGTNASKYGALSVPGGSVDIAWSIDRKGEEPCFELTWRESGGPEVTEPKTRGFGSMLLERSIAYELDGRARIDYEPRGLACTISIPLRTIRPFVAETIAEAPPPVTEHA